MQYTLTAWWLFRKNCSSVWIHHFLLVPPPTVPFGVYYVCIQCTPYYTTWTITSQTTCRNWTYWISSSLFSVRFPYLYHFYSTHQPIDTIVCIFQIHEIILFMISVTYYFISMYTVYSNIYGRNQTSGHQTSRYRVGNVSLTC